MEQIQAKTKGEIEDLLTKESIIFYKKVLGVGPSEAKTYILQDMIIIRFKGQLLPIERQLLRGKEGIKFIKDIRQSIHNLITNDLIKIITRITKQTVISVHSDISTKTGELVKIFILKENYQKKLESEIL